MDHSPRPIRHLPHPPRPSFRRARLLPLTVLATVGLVGGFVPAAHAEVSAGPLAPAAAPAKIERFARYQPQSTCDPVAKPGTVALANMLLDYYGAGHSGGITRDCAIGGRSEHKEGRAWDWMLDSTDSRERAVAEDFIAWLLGEGPGGEAAYNARRLGVMYIIWNRQIWSASHAKSGWLPYGGPHPHTDHVHISLTWAGAMQETSFWDGTAADVGRRSDSRSNEPDPVPVEDDERDKND